MSKVVEQSLQFPSNVSILPKDGHIQLPLVLIEKPFEQYVHEAGLQEMHVGPYKVMHFTHELFANKTIPVAVH